MQYEVMTVRGLCVPVQYLVMGPLQNNVYVIEDGDGVFVVDPSIDADAILDAVGDRKVNAIVITHAHWDHMGAAGELRERTNAPVIASEVEVDSIENPKEGFGSRVAVPCKVDKPLSNGEEITIGKTKWKAILTPGHSKGSMCLFCIPAFGLDEDGLAVLVSGDTLFNGTVGRTDFEGGSMKDMTASMKKLAALPDDTVVLPGHNALTTILDERRRVFARFGAE